MDLERPEGVLITDLYPAGPAERAGLKQGDLITAIDGASVNDAATLDYRVATRQAGDEVSLTVRRGKEPARAVRVRIEPLPGGGTGAEVAITGRNPLNGASVVDLSPAVAEQLGVDPFAVGSGVLVTKIGEGYAARMGLQPGDLIRGVNGTPVTTVKGLQALLATPAHTWRVTIQRGGQQITAEVGL
jgi:S1-C subfamily serine protease